MEIPAEIIFLTLTEIELEDHGEKKITMMYEKEQ